MSVASHEQRCSRQLTVVRYRANTHLLELNNVRVQQLSMVDDFGFHILVDMLSPRYKLDSNVCPFVQLILCKLNESKGPRVKIFTLFIAFVIR